MTAEAHEKRVAHIRSVTVTSLAALGGVTAAIISAAMATGPKDRFALYIMLGFVLVQFPVLRVLGIDVEEFSTKDYIYVAFMTFSLWFVTWAIVLTTGASISF